MSTTTTTPVTPHFEWHPQPAASAVVHRLFASAVKRCPDLAAFAKRLLGETGTRLIDWVDTIAIVPAIEDAGKKLTGELEAVGFKLGKDSKHHHADGLFPAVLVGRNEFDCDYVVIKVDSVVDFLSVNRLMDGREIIGTPFEVERTAEAFRSAELRVLVRENHGVNLSKHDRSKPLQLADACESFRLRQRGFDDSADGFAHANKLVTQSIKHIGVDRTADLFFAAEREYWMNRNKAARAQYARQQLLGLGWANHDHHTYRSSREHFADLISLLELLGFDCRERFYAGREAGWGAQVLEQPNARVIIFADVDLSPEEVTNDFAHEPLSPRKELGTVGLWCQLHGESFLEAGMHHLECQFDFDAARKQLSEDTGVRAMDPFTDFDYLKQCFTPGETWEVDPRRVDRLLQAGQITSEQAKRFRMEGAIGSHMEILERNDGYKGFNQTGINEIILKTDPRN